MNLHVHHTQQPQTSPRIPSPPHKHSRCASGSLDSLTCMSKSLPGRRRKKRRQLSWWPGSTRLPVPCTLLKWVEVLHFPPAIVFIHFTLLHFTSLHVASQCFWDARFSCCRCVLDLNESTRAANFSTKHHRRCSYRPKRRKTIDQCHAGQAITFKIAGVKRSSDLMLRQPRPQHPTYSHQEHHHTNVLPPGLKKSNSGPKKESSFGLTRNRTKNAIRPITWLAVRTTTSRRLLAPRMALLSTTTLHASTDNHNHNQSQKLNLHLLSTHMHQFSVPEVPGNGFLLQCIPKCHRYPLTIRNSTWAHTWL